MSLIAYHQIDICEHTACYASFCHYAAVNNGIVGLVGVAGDEDIYFIVGGFYNIYKGVARIQALVI